MILVDSSVWIDYFRGTSTPQTDRPNSLDDEPIAIGDLILVEGLQGFIVDATVGVPKPCSRRSN